MMAHAMVRPLAEKNGPQVGDSATQRPATSASINIAIPKSDASIVFPGRHTFIQKPITSAMGMVQTIVKTPHGECSSARTTTRASTARRITMIARIATMASIPVSGPISSRAI